MLPRLSDEAVFHHVPVGPFRALVRWRDERVPIAVLEGDVTADAVEEIAAEASEGRHVVLDADGDGVWRDSRDRILRLEPDGGPTCEIRCRRVAGTSRWRSVDRVPAGVYHATVHPRGEPMRAEAETGLTVRTLSDATEEMSDVAILEILVP